MFGDRSQFYSQAYFILLVALTDLILRGEAITFTLLQFMVASAVSKFSLPLDLQVVLKDSVKANVSSLCKVQ